MHREVRRRLLQNSSGSCRIHSSVEPFFFMRSQVGRCAARHPIFTPFFTSAHASAVEPGAKLSRPRHHALGGTSLAPSPVHSFELANLHDDSKRPRVPVCFSCERQRMKVAVPSQGPQGRRPRAGARPRSLRFGHVHQPGWRMQAVLVSVEINHIK